MFDVFGDADRSKHSGAIASSEFVSGASSLIVFKRLVQLWVSGGLLASFFEEVTASSWEGVVFVVTFSLTQSADDFLSEVLQAWSHTHFLRHSFSQPNGVTVSSSISLHYRTLRPKQELLIKRDKSLRRINDKTC